MLYNLGVFYSEMSLIKKSIETLERCISIEPSFANALVALGFSYYRQGMDEKAMDTLQKALDIEPNNFYALKNLGALYNKAGDPDLTISTFKKTEGQMPATPDVAYGLGQAYELKKQYDEAIERYKKVKVSGAPEIFTDGATEGLNRLAMTQARETGGGSRTDVVIYSNMPGKLKCMGKEDNKAKLRFEEQPGNMELIFIPQCADCTNNIDGTSCKHFGLIPALYQRTDTVYPALDKE